MILRRNKQLITSALLLASAGMAVLSGCGTARPTVLGAAPKNAPDTTAAAIAQATVARAVTLQGEMVEKCPVAGCWFKLRDKTGVVRVDTKAAGFVVSDVPLHTQMTVSGKIMPGSEAQVAAAGLRY